MIHIVSFSTGLSSALTVERVRERYGEKNTMIVFMDTGIEDEDNYRFMADMQKRWAGMEFVVLADGRSPLQVAEDEHIIPNYRVASCTRRLKIFPFKKFLKKFDPSEITIHIGFDFQEVHRCASTKKNYEKLGYAVDFPLLWKPIEYRTYEQVCRDDWGVEPPRMYAMGYSHANCGGTCIKQGQSDWTRTLVNFPERFMEVEEWERRMREHPKRAPHALLRSSRGGETVPMTLQQLREEYEQMSNANPSFFDSGGCVVCGIGVVDLGDDDGEDDDIDGGVD